VKEFGLLKNVPTNRMANLRNDMYVVSETLRLVEKSGKTEFTADDLKVLANYKNISTWPRSSFPPGSRSRLPWRSAWGQ